MKARHSGSQPTSVAGGRCRRLTRAANIARHALPDEANGRVEMFESRIPQEQPSRKLEAVVLKMGERDAQSLASRTSMTDAVLLKPLTPGVWLTLFECNRQIGVVCEVPAEPERLQRLVALPTLSVCILDGGPKRLQVRNQDIVLLLRVVVCTAGAATPRSDL